MYRRIPSRVEQDPEGLSGSDTAVDRSDPVPVAAAPVSAPALPRLRRVPAPVIDAGLAVALAIAITIGIRTAPQQQWGAPDALAYGIGISIAAYSLGRRRYPLLVLLASAATLQVYYFLDFPAPFPAVPLSVALATAWAAGHRRASLLIAVWFALGPLGWVVYQLWARTEPVLSLLGEAVTSTAMFAAVLVLGEAIRTRQALAFEQARSERLLLNVLPRSIAARLKDGEGVIADALPEATVLFADLVDFTRRSQRLSPKEVVSVLNELFSAFDALANRHGLEKIKTIGDAYMVASGVPDPRPDHAEAAAEMALAMRAEATRHVDPDGQPLQVRIGMDTGLVVAGVIGTSRFGYDLWGDAVNTASRMESHGVAGRIQVTARTYELLRGKYRFERRSPINVKGKGEMQTWFLLDGGHGEPP